MGLIGWIDRVLIGWLLMGYVMIPDTALWGPSHRSQTERPVSGI